MQKLPLTKGRVQFSLLPITEFLITALVISFDEVIIFLIFILSLYTSNILLIFYCFFMIIPLFLKLWLLFNWRWFRPFFLFRHCDLELVLV